jgi:YidC/Oxa1 family membrane protein insertase
MGFVNFFYTLLYPLEWLISWVMWLWHWFFVNVLRMPGGSSFAWCLAIIFLTFTVRAAITPLFARQMRSMNKMQAIQPEMQKIQKKYKGKTDAASREAMSRETMKLYRENNVSPTSSCLPSLVQAPVFMALYNVLYKLSSIATGKEGEIGAFTKPVAKEIENTVFINVKLSDLFNQTQGAGKWTIGIFVALMCLTMWFQQFYNMRVNMPEAAKQGQQWRMQQSMTYIFPIMYIFSGIIAPFGVLLYWLTNNLWTVGQTIWQINTFPTAGSKAAIRKEKRDHDREDARRAKAGLPSLEEEALEKARQEKLDREKNGFQRQQPVRRKNRHRK